jgi:predicted subunit of tRNA(5-methylaminomethyl-2-thiouridylate) methyltransferase
VTTVSETINSGESIAAIMFSGGRDSSLAAVTYCLRGREIQLLRFATGLGISSQLPEIRETELRTRFGKQILPTPSPIPIHGLVRRIAIAEIEADFQEFEGKNLVLLGEKLAIHAAALVFCLNNGIDLLADGTSGYQSDLPEQRGTAVEFFCELSSKFHIKYETPIKEMRSDTDVKYSLLEAGISTKSLEGLSMFADSFTRASDRSVRGYLEKKKDLAVQYIQRFTAHGISFL